MDAAEDRLAPLRRVGILLVVTVVLLFVYLLYVSGQTGGLTDVNSMEYAVIARNIARTGHYTTDILKPLSLARFPSVANQPDTIYPPLQPLWEALWLKAMGMSPNAIPLACGFWLFAGGLLILILGTLWFDVRVGAAAAILYVLNPTMLELSAGGAETPLLAFELLLLMAAVVAYLRAEPRSPIKAAGIGATAGLLCLTKYCYGPSIVPALVAVYFLTPRKSRWMMLGACAGAFVLVLSPWLVRNTLVAGSPFFSLTWAEALMQTRTHPGNTLYRTATTSYPPWLLFALTSPREVLEKLRSGLQVAFSVPLTSAGPYVGAFFLAGVLTALGKRPIEVGRYVLYAAYLLACGVLLILFPEQRLLAALAAPATLLALAFFVRLLDGATAGFLAPNRVRLVALGLVLLGIVHCLPTALRLMSGRPAGAVQAAQMKQAAREVASLVDGPVVTDVPWPISWYGDVTTIWLPVSRDELKKVEDITGPVKWLLLTPFVERMKNSERTQQWATIWATSLQRDTVFDGFTVYRRLPDNWVLYERTPVVPRPRR